MANINAKFGLRPIGKLGSAANSTGTTEYDILTGTTGSIFTGDPVKMVNTGGIAVAAAVQCERKSISRARGDRYPLYNFSRASISGCKENTWVAHVDDFNMSRFCCLDNPASESF